MGLTERHWFEDEDVPENDEWALEDAISMYDKAYRRGYQKGFSDGAKEREAVKPCLDYDWQTMEPSIDRDKVVENLEKAKTIIEKWVPMFEQYNTPFGIDVAIGLLKEQEAHELTKTEWEQWKKDENREPICMVWYGDTTPIWILKPENISEPLYFMGKIKLFDKKPLKEQVKWNGLD